MYWERTEGTLTWWASVPFWNEHTSKVPDIDPNQIFRLKILSDKSAPVAHRMEWTWRFKTGKSGIWAHMWALQMILGQKNPSRFSVLFLYALASIRLKVKLCPLAHYIRDNDWALRRAWEIFWERTERRPHKSLVERFWQEHTWYISTVSLYRLASIEGFTWRFTWRVLEGPHGVDAQAFDILSLRDFEERGRLPATFDLQESV